MTPTERPPLSDEHWQAINHIAKQLNEPKRNLIANLIQHTSLESALALLQEALTIQAQGGMLTQDGSRQRTPGGIFFFLARQRLPPELVRVVFPYSGKKHRKRREAAQKQRSTPTPRVNPSPFPWDERLALLTPLLAEPGRASTIKVVLIGRPQQIKRDSSHVVLRLTDSSQLPNLPAGVPHPELAPTTYFVFVGDKQWQKVEAPLRADTEDFLIIEGLCAFNEALGGLVVYATNTTTRNLQAQQRQAKDS